MQAWRLNRSEPSSSFEKLFLQPVLHLGSSNLYCRNTALCHGDPEYSPRWTTRKQIPQLRFQFRLWFIECTPGVSTDRNLPAALKNCFCNLYYTWKVQIYTAEILHCAPGTQNTPLHGQRGSKYPNFVSNYICVLLNARLGSQPIGTFQQL